MARAVTADKTAAERSSGQPASGRKLRAQGQRTMAKLLDAGLEVFGERGYHAARVDDVVRRAKTSHGTFYLYFANKEDLLHVLASECADEMQQLADGMGEITPDEAGRAELRKWLEGFYSTYTRFGAVIRTWMEEHKPNSELGRMGGEAFTTLAATLGKHMGKHQRAGGSGQKGRGRRTELTAALLIAMVERISYYMSSRGLPADDDKVLDDLTLLIHRGFFGG